MTKEEAQKELWELEPLEVAAWNKATQLIEKRNTERERLLRQAAEVNPRFEPMIKEANDEWMPLYKRATQLRTFLEVA